MGSSQVLRLMEEEAGPRGGSVAQQALLGAAWTGCRREVLLAVGFPPPSLPARDNSQDHYQQGERAGNSQRRGGGGRGPCVPWCSSQTPRGWLPRGTMTHGLYSHGGLSQRCYLSGCSFIGVQSKDSERLKVCLFVCVCVC